MEREESLLAREKVMENKELVLKKALATVKKLKFQLQQANTKVSNEEGWGDSSLPFIGLIFSF